MPPEQAAEAEPSGRPVARATSGPAPNESPKECVDRELRELLDEVPVILPGVEILFGS